MFDWLQESKNSNNQLPELVRQSSTIKEDPTYFGGMKNGNKDGWGTKIYTDGGRYEGLWKNGMMHGFGTFKFANGGVFVGNWKEDQATGQGV